MEPEPLEPVEGEPGWAGDGSDPEPSSPDPVRTGSASVDEVIRSVEELEERPIEEHVGVFESAQVQLRRALDDPGDEGQPGGADHPDDHPGHA
jgi:hypothetical protein